MSKVLQKFTVYDLVIMAIMAALGVAIKPIVVPLAHLISGPLMIPGGSLAGGLYMMWIVVAYGIVGKPGAATLTALIQALLIFLTGIIGSHGIMTFLTYIAPGIAVDVVMLLMRHRVCCRPCTVIATAIANLTGTICVNLVFFQAPGVYLILIIAISLFSGAIGGLIAWELIKVIDKYKLKRKSKSGWNKKNIARDMDDEVEENDPGTKEA